MAKKDYGNIVFYRTKDGKLRWFDPDKVKTPEGKAKIKEIRSGKSKNAKIGTRSEKDQVKVDQATKDTFEKNKTYSKAAAKYREAVADKKDIGKAAKAVNKASREWREFVNNEARAHLNKINPGDTIHRDDLNIERAKKKAEERAHEKELKEKATNPNFDEKKYGKYFDNEGKLIPEKMGEWMNKKKGEELNKKSAEAQKERMKKHVIGIKKEFSRIPSRDYEGHRIYKVTNKDYVVYKDNEKGTIVHEKTLKEAKAAIDKLKELRSGKVKISDMAEERKKKISYYSDADKNDVEFRKSALSEMRRYENNWSGMTAREKKNISPGGIKEIRARIKELEEVDKAKKKKIWKD